jgi:predicted RNA-binding protein
MNNKRSLIAVAAVALLALAGCGSMGDILGNDSNNTSDIRGTVSSVDPSSHTIWLTNTSGNRSMLSGSNGGDVRLDYDNNTRVNYNGQTFRPEDLDRGDQVSVRAVQNGNRLVADTIDVTYNSTSSSSSSYPNGPVNGPYNQTVTGTVRSVDTSRHQIQLDRGYGSTIWVDYDANTYVTFNGRSYQPSDLERGDEITITATDTGGGRLRANNVSVTRSVSGSTSSSNGTYGNYATVRGTVRSIDTYSHTIQLEQTNWISGFNPGTNSSYVTVQYDPNASIDVNGQMQSLSGLERGDMIEVQVTSNGGNSNWFANRITLVRNVRQ